MNFNVEDLHNQICMLDSNAEWSCSYLRESMSEDIPQIMFRISEPSDQKINEKTVYMGVHTEKISPYAIPEMVNELTLFIKEDLNIDDTEDINPDELQVTDKPESVDTPNFLYSDDVISSVCMCCGDILNQEKRIIFDRQSGSRKKCIQFHLECVPQVLSILESAQRSSLLRII